MKFINAFKSIFSNFRSFTEDDLTVLMKACNDANIDKIDKLFKKKTKINPLPIQSVLVSIAMQGNVSLMDYFLTSKNTIQFQQPEVSLDKSLAWAGLYNHLDLIFKIILECC